METTDQLINRKALEALIRHAIKNTYRTRCSDTVSEGFLQNSIALFSKDYTVSVIDNNWGELCGHYPSKIVILGHNCFGQQTPVDIGQLRESIVRSRVARCRSRFVVPVILFNGKFICRSSTLSSGPEMYSRQLYNLVLGSSNDSPAVVQTDPNNANAGDWQMFSRVRNQDILLLKKFNVGFIVDLMVEKKKVKYGLNVTSSEKVDKENRYADFGIASIPFPGCEFFKEWKDNGYRTKGIAFDWTQGFVDALLELPTTPPPLSGIDWSKYKEWDIVTLTQNYLKLILNYLKHGDTGMLIHCISGWDRTPMFISLVRLSLWSEGLIHQTLAPHEILYLTIAYDWYLFGHNFPDRIYKGEDVFYFCFHFLKFITEDEFNIYPRHHHFIPHAEKQNLMKDQDSSFPLLPCSRSSTNSINSNHSNGCCDDVTDDESTVRINSAKKSNVTFARNQNLRFERARDHRHDDHCLHRISFSPPRSQEASRNIPETSTADVEDRACPTNHDGGSTTSPLAMPVASAENDDSEESNVTPTNSTPNSSLDHADSNHNSRPIFSNDVEMPQFFVPAFQRNTEPVPVPSPVIVMGMPEIRGSTPHSYGSWQMVGPNEMENYYHKSTRRPSESESQTGHSNDRKMKLMAVHNLFASVFKSASEPSVPESNSVLGLSNLFESLFGNYKA